MSAGARSVQAASSQPPFVTLFSAAWCGVDVEVALMLHTHMVPQQCVGMVPGVEGAYRVVPRPRRTAVCCVYSQRGRFLPDGWLPLGMGNWALFFLPHEGGE